jgi:hypothetical protein
VGLVTVAIPDECPTAIRADVQRESDEPIYKTFSATNHGSDNIDDNDQGGRNLRDSVSTIKFFPSRLTLLIALRTTLCDIGQKITTPCTSVRCCGVRDVAIIITRRVRDAMKASQTIAAKTAWGVESFYVRVVCSTGTASCRFTELR